MNIPTLRDVYQARATISPYIDRTPLTYSAALSEALEAEVYLKHEEHLPLGAFKSRGGINLLAGMSEAERSRGIITASSGNHGQSIASACRMFGAKALIGLPVDANPNKVAAMESLGRAAHFPRRELRRSTGALRAVGPGGRLPLRASGQRDGPDCRRSDGQP